MNIRLLAVNVRKLAVNVRRSRVNVHRSVVNLRRLAVNLGKLVVNVHLSIFAKLLFKDKNDCNQSLLDYFGTSDVNYFSFGV